MFRFLNLQAAALDQPELGVGVRTGFDKAEPYNHETALWRLLANTVRMRIRLRSHLPLTALDPLGGHQKR